MQKRETWEEFGREWQGNLITNNRVSGQKSEELKEGEGRKLLL